MQSPTHPYTHSTPLHLLKNITNINISQLSQSLFTNIYKYPHSTCLNPYNNNCHNPYNQNSILTILKITTVTIPYKKKKKNYHNITFEDSRPLCAGHGAADAL